MVLIDTIASVGAKPKAASEWVGSLGVWRFASINPDAADTYVLVNTIVQVSLRHPHGSIAIARGTTVVFATLLMSVVSNSREKQRDLEGEYKTWHIGWRTSWLANLLRRESKGFMAPWVGHGDPIRVGNGERVRFRCKCDR